MTVANPSWYSIMTQMVCIFKGFIVAMTQCFLDISGFNNGNDRIRGRSVLPSPESPLQFCACIITWRIQCITGMWPLMLNKVIVSNLNLQSVIRLYCHHGRARSFASAPHTTYLVITCKSRLFVRPAWMYYPMKVATSISLPHKHIKLTLSYL